MGLIGVIISSSAGCLSVALSFLAIRRNVRRRKRQNRRRTTDLRITATADITANNATGARNTAFIKTSTSELVRKRRAAIVRTHYGNTMVSTGSCASDTSRLHSIHRNAGEGYPLDEMEKTAANSVVQKLEENTTIFHQDAQTVSTPLKEFTVVGSSDIADDDCSPDGLEEDSFFAGNVTGNESVTNESCSETESCSLAEDEFLSEEEILGATEDGRFAEEMDKTWASAQPCPKRAKRVSFQFASGAGEQRNLFNSRADHENPVTENVLAIENLLQPEDVEIIPGNEEAQSGTFGIQSGSPSRFLEVMDRSVLSGGSDAIARTQEYSERNDGGQGILFHIGQRYETTAKARKPLFVSAEPLAQMPVLDDALNLSPTSASPEVKDSPVSWAAGATPNKPEKNTKDIDERGSISTPQLQKEYSQASYRSSVEEKENISGSLASSPERLSRKPRREVEKSGMFRRSSYPSFRRFRFSDRIKVRPLRSSGRNSK